jgi:hypothetical protein
MARNPPTGVGSADYAPSVLIRPTAELLGTRGLKKRLAIGGGGGAKFPFVSRRAGARSLE